MVIKWAENRDEGAETHPREDPLVSRSRHALSPVLGSVNQYSSDAIADSLLTLVAYIRMIEYTGEYAGDAAHI